MRKRGQAIRATSATLLGKALAENNPMQPSRKWQAATKLSFPKRNLQERKGQAATEFLMTYGWTILVIMIIIAVLFALGGFDIKTPNTCFTPDPYKCLDVKFTSSTNTFTALISGSGIDGTSNDNKANTIKINGQDCAITQGDLKDSEDAAKEVRCILNGLSKGNKFDGIISLSYRKYGGNAHTVNGQFSGTVE